MTTIAKFTAFHHNNPGLWSDFVRIAQALKAKHQTGCSARDWIRFSSQRRFIDSTGEVYRLNNDYSPIYVRLLEFIYPEYIGVFESRESKYDHISVAEWAEISGIKAGQLELFQ